MTWERGAPRVFMRIGIHTQYYPPESGAPQARLSELAEAFRRNQHEVNVLTAMPSYPAGTLHKGYGGLFKREQVSGINVTRTYVYPNKRARVAPRLANYLSFALSSGALGPLALPRLDYLMTESPPLFLGMSGYALSKSRGARWIFNVSDLWPESLVELGAARPGLALDMARRLETFCYRQAWLLTGQSAEILSDISARFPHVPTHHLSNGVNTTRFTPAARSQSARTELAGTPDHQDRCIVVYAGLHGLAQGLDRVINAAETLATLKHLTLVFIGDGPNREALIKQARHINAPRLRFLGPRPAAEIPALLASADIALAPLTTLLRGAVPSKIYEAMAAGVPLILSAGGEAAEIVTRAKAGLVTPPGDARAIAAAIRTLSGDRDKRKRLGAAGRAAAVRHYDRTAISAGFVSLLARSRGLPHPRS